MTSEFELLPPEVLEPEVDPGVIAVARPQIPGLTVCRDKPDTNHYYPVDRTQLGDYSLSASGILLRNYLQWGNFGDHHIEGYDHWINLNSYNNVFGRLLTFKNGDTITFENLKIHPPSYPEHNHPIPMTPQRAREQKLTYGSVWYADFVHRKGGPTGEIIESRRVPIVTMPIPLKSAQCILHGKTKDELMRLGEDAEDVGGYFIIEGAEKVILLQELLAVNKIFVMNMSNQPSGTIVRIIANTPRSTALVELAFDEGNTQVIKIKFPSLKPDYIDKLKAEQTEKPSKKKENKVNSLNVLALFRIYQISDINTIKGLIGMFIKAEWRSKALLKLTRTIVDYLQFPNDLEHVAVLTGKIKATYQEQKERLDRILNNDFFPHMNDLPGFEGETVEERNARILNGKLYLLSAMIARFLEYMAGFRILDDRDSWSNKRLEGAGRLMESLFRNAWRRNLGVISSLIEEGKITNLQQVHTKFSADNINKVFRDSFVTSNWGVKGSKLKSNVAQTLVRDSVIATYAHITTVDVNISRTDRQPSLRLVQNSQWGFIDPVSTPEGAVCGIVKNLSLTAKVSLERSDSLVILTLLGSTDIDANIEPMVKMIPDDPALPQKVLINGKFLGWCDGLATREFLINQRRYGYMPCDMSVILDDDWLYIDISPSRLIRPLLIVNPDQTLAIDTLNSRGESNYTLLNTGAMEYISAWEQEYIKVSSSVENIIKRTELVSEKTEMFRKAQEEYDLVSNGETVLVDEISETETDQYLTIDGAKALIKLAQDNLTKIYNGEEVMTSNDEEILTEDQAQVLLDRAIADHDKIIQGEQVMITVATVTGSRPLTLDEATIALNDAKIEMDILAKNTPYTHCEIDPQSILGVASALIPWLDHNPAPRNTYQVSMGKQALGIYHSNHQNRFDGKTKLLAFPIRPMVETEMYEIIGLDNRGPGQSPNVAFMAFPNTEEDSFVVKKEYLDAGGFRMYKYLTYSTIVHNKTAEIEEKLCQILDPPDPERYKYIGPNGLPFIGAPLKTGDCVISKVQYILNRGGEVRNDCEYMRVGDQGIVDKILVTSDQKYTTVIVKLRTMRVPQAGDKFAPRNAQKGTIGLVMSDVDLPTDEHGVSPDFIVNTSCIPSRMTVSYPQELVASKHGALRGLHINATGFHPFELNKYRATLTEYGYQEFGYEIMRSGTSGRLLDSNIFMGPIFFQALKHHVADKVQARSRGSVKPMTRQPPKGRGNHGGLRFGEMERDAGISHGSTALLRERLMYVSDAYQTVFCKQCGTFAVNSLIHDKYICRLCGDSATFGKATIPYAYKLLIQLLAAPGMNLHPRFVTSEEYLQSMLGNKNVNINDVDKLLDDLQEIDEADQAEEEELAKEQLDEEDFTYYDE